MANFSDCIDYILENEGGYTDDRADRGGCTNYGITLGDCARYPLAKIYNCDQLRSMPESTAKHIYNVLYWKYDMIADRRIATKLLDMAVNIGPFSTTLFQRGLNSCNVKRVVVDGHWGSETVKAINSSDPDGYLTELVDQSHIYYGKVVAKRPSQAIFLRGWLTRADRLPS